MRTAKVCLVLQRAASIRVVIRFTIVIKTSIKLLRVQVIQVLNVIVVLLQVTLASSPLPQSKVSIFELL